MNDKVYNLFMKNILHTWFGNREFYKMVMAIALPLVIQQFISTFVSLLDNIMVGQVGTLAMSAVSISNQLLMVVTLAMIGSVNAAGIFSAQYYGKKDIKGMQACLRFKIYIAVFFALLGILIFSLFGQNLVNLYMNESANDINSINQTMHYALDYIDIMLFGIVPFAISTALGSSMRDTGKTIIVMVGSLCGVFVNFCLNYCLIFGHFGFPQLGVEGAAVATVISRFVEMSVIIFGTIHHKKDYYPYVEGLFHEIHVPVELVKKIARKGTPLIFNEIFWSIGLAAISQRYSTRGLDAIAAININDTVSNLFAMSSMSLGIAVSILVGQRLGAGKIEEAKDIDRKMLTFSIMVSVVFTIILYSASPYLPLIYRTDANVQDLACTLLRITSLTLPLSAICNTCYYTLRAGGKTVLTFLFDCGYVCIVSYITASVLVVFTNLPIAYIYFIVRMMDILKAVIGLVLLHKGVWIHNLVN